MLQREGVVLEGGVPVGLGGVPGVARLGEESEVGEHLPVHQLPGVEEPFSRSPCGAVNDEGAEDGGDGAGEE